MVSPFLSLFPLCVYSLLTGDPVVIPLNVAPVIVARGYSGSAVVRTGGGGVCTLKWDARGETPQTSANEAATRAALASLTGVCVTMPPSTMSFGYRVCLGEGGSAQQESNDGKVTIKVGVYSPPPPGAPINAQYFVDGEKCGSVARKGVVMLHCGEVAGVGSTEEPSTCSYIMHVDHPSLCAEEVRMDFPRMVARPALGGVVVQSAPTRRLKGLAGLVAALPKSLGEMVKTWVGFPPQEAPAPPAPPSNPGNLAQVDAEGMGGRTLGLDDSERHGGRWLGMREGEESVSAWVLEARESEMSGEGSGGEEWLCTAYSADDLRKGTEVGEGSGGVVLLSASLTMTSAKGGGMKVVGARARGMNRQNLALPEGEEQGGMEGGKPLTVAWSAPEGKGGKDLLQEGLEIAALTVRVQDL